MHPCDKCDRVFASTRGLRMHNQKNRDCDKNKADAMTNLMRRKQVVNTPINVRLLGLDILKVLNEDKNDKDVIVATLLLRELLRNFTNYVIDGADENEISKEWQALIGESMEPYKKCIAKYFA